MSGAGEQEPFAEWLRDEIDRRDWTIAEFARRCGVIRQTAQKWVRGERIPDPPFCYLIADALGADRDFVLDLAGHRPDARKGEIDLSDPLVSVSAANADKLTDEQKLALAEIIRSMVRGNE